MAWMTAATIPTKNKTVLADPAMTTILNVNPFNPVATGMPKMHFYVLNIHVISRM